LQILTDTSREQQHDRTAEVLGLVGLRAKVPSALDPPSGCRFHPRCPQAMARCSAEAPTRKEVAPGHSVSCHLYKARLQLF